MMHSAPNSDGYPFRAIETAPGPTLALCPSPNLTDIEDETEDIAQLEALESRSVGIYAIVLFIGIMLISGAIVMLSDDIPRWLAGHEQNLAVSADKTNAIEPFTMSSSIGVLSLPKHQTSAPGLNANKQANKTAIAYPKLPNNFDPSWRQRLLDLDTAPITLLTLKHPFRLSDTTQKSGVEFFSYHAYLLRQIATQIDDAMLQQKFLNLSRLNDKMANQLNIAIHSEFNGMPSSNFDHIHKKEQALEALSSINDDPLRLLSTDRAGNVIRSNQIGAAENFVPGSDLAEYQRLVKQIINHPYMRQKHPDISALVISQSNTLQNIGRHLELRWESHFSCLKAACEKSPESARIFSTNIYVKQTLRDLKG